MGTWLVLAAAQAAEPPETQAPAFAVQVARLPTLEEARSALPAIALITSLPLRIVRQDEGVAIQAGPLADLQDAQRLQAQVKFQGYADAMLTPPAKDAETLFQAASAPASAAPLQHSAHPHSPAVTRGPEAAVFPPTERELTASDSLDQAWKAYKRRDYETAADLFRAFARQSGSHAREAAWGLALVHYRRGQYGEAAALLEQLLGKGYRPDEVRPLYADALYRQQHPAEADGEPDCRRLLSDWSLSASACSHPWLRNAAELIHR